MTGLNVLGRPSATLLTRSGQAEFPNRAITWQNARMYASTDQPCDPLTRLRAAAAAREAAGLRRRLVPREPGAGILDLASNDYLGLSGDPRLAEASGRAARAWGTGSTGSRLVTGTTALHADLEAELAEFAGAPEALVFSSGYLANLATVTALAAALAEPRTALAEPGTALAESGTAGCVDRGGVLIVSDELNHASLIDACRLARGRHVRLEVTPHRDTSAVAAALAGRAERAAMIVTDAVFSVSGRVAPVGELRALARRHGALLVLDEAHSFGLLGDGGRGIGHGLGLTGADAPDVVRTVTLSKSLSGQGGAVLGAPEVIQTLVDTGRGMIFDTGLAPPSAGAALEALRILRADPGLPGRALRNTVRLAEMAAGLGLAAAVPDAAVTSVMLGDPVIALAAQKECAAHGVRVGCFRPPSVPAGRACLRLTGRATLTEEDFRVAYQALAVTAEHCDHCRNTAQAGRSAR
jgi:8-amino-7-oxononanoate synthase